MTVTEDASPVNARILTGLRVLDLSCGLAGPVAAQLLAEAGADVIKVEPPEGELTRRRHPSAFRTWNRGKRSVVLDPDAPALRSLLASADVLVHSLRPATARRHELDDETLAARFPRLVVCGIGGWPPGHRDAGRAGYDLLVQAREGLLDMQSGWRPGPYAWRFPAPSWGAAFLATAGILARLIHRESTGRGGAAHTSLAQGVHLVQNIAWNRAERPSPSLAEGQPGTLTSTQTAMYECGDGRWLQIMNPADRVDLSVLPLMRSALAAAGRAEKEFTAENMRAAMRQAPAAAWLAAIRAVDVAVELITPLGSLLADEDVAANGYVVEVHDPEHGRIRQAAAPFRTQPPSAVAVPAPSLGAHTADLLGETVVAPTVSPSAAGPSRPLEGIRVVDFGAYLAGPLAPMLLADLGAEVIKVEPVRGDPVRGWRDGFYAACNRGKRGLALDLHSPEGARVRDRLLAWADVVHHNIRAVAAPRLGLDEASVRAVNPRVVFSHCSAYGSRGERANWPGYDSVFQAMAGWNIENAGEGNPPLFNHLGTLDILTAASSAVATLLALYHRRRTGAAGATACSLLNTATFTSSETFLDESGAVAPYPRLDSAQSGLGPDYCIRPAADGWVALVAPDEERLSVVRATDFAGLTASEAAARLTAAGVPAEEVREFRWFSVWDDEENLRTRQVVSYPHCEWGELRQFGAYWDFGELSLKLDRACPGVGEHTTEILTELGFSPGDVAALARSGAVAGPELPVTGSA
ncbi:CoA transferase [Amycolatopsis sp.]|uniref:CaiB/BaiF CoA-transferase family protein n=1 Tax=Amycolatopsis sp. TaxID=37632 RepID=UPI002CA570F0|nr:CoA transferase [Amycolatopsis sp.]HVV12679.1 CoA transferase [Amycolatopsis sp.]